MARASMLGRLIASEYLTLLLCGTYAAIMAVVRPEFATRENFAVILATMAPLLVVATGQTLVLVTGGIDLSATSIIALASVSGAMLVNDETGPLAGSPMAGLLAIAVMLAVGMSIGVLNGLVITRLRMPPFIVTLTGMMFFSGLAIWLTRSQPIYGLPDSLLAIGRDSFQLFGWTIMPLAMVVAVAVVTAGELVLTRTLLGRWLFAVGQNARTAEVCGIPVSRVLLVAYTLAGLSAGLAAVLITGRMETGSPVHWQKNLLDIIGAVVIGGTSLYGGRGRVIWTVFGVLFLALLDNSLNLLNVSYFTIMIIKGMVILAAAGLDALRVRLGSRA